MTEIFIRNFLLWPLTANHYSFLDGIDKPPAYPAGNRGKPQILGSCPGAAESRRKNRAGDFSRGTATVFISESILQKAGTKRESCVRGTDACSIPGSGDSAEAGVKEYFRKKNGNNDFKNYFLEIKEKIFKDNEIIKKIFEHFINPLIVLMYLPFDS